MSLKLKPLKLKTLIHSPPSEPPRNSFTSTDYYRKTRDEYYSPISYMESSSVLSPPCSRFWAESFQAWQPVRCFVGDLVTKLGGSGTFPLHITALHPSRVQAHIREAGECDNGEENETGAQRAAKRTANLRHVFDILFRKWFPSKRKSK